MKFVDFWFKGLYENYFILIENSVWSCMDNAAISETPLAKVMATSFEGQVKGSDRCQKFKGEL